MTDASYSGQQSYADAGTDYSTLAFVVKSILSRTATATLVQVKAVTNVGDVAPVGFIDVQPMVAQLDGRGQPTPHGIIHNVPYLRVQGGANAVIIDPAVGDIGICVFGSHDLSSVKKNKAPSNPGSRRRFSMADALYIGGVLNGTPTQYIRFTADGDVEIKPASKVTILGDLHVSGEAFIGAEPITITTHKHSGVSTGGDESGPPV
jgi:hypothetical protein